MLHRIHMMLFPRMETTIHYILQRFSLYLNPDERLTSTHNKYVPRLDKYRPIRRLETPY